MTFTSIALVAFVICVLFSLFYWHVFYAITVRSLRYELFAIRDEVRRLAVERRMVESSSFRKLESLINDTIRLGPHISLLSFGLFIAQKPPIDREEINRFNDEAPKEFRKLRDKTAKTLLVTMMLNSPWAVCFGSLLFLVLWARGKISRFLLYRGAETFVEAIHPGSSC